MSLRQNVLFGNKFNKRRYVKTIEACQLEADLKLMPAGDRSEIGERGVTLSGGQKARLSLARAVYHKSDIILMDDPISALDADVRKKVFQLVFKGILRKKTRILVTHSVDFLHLADQIVIMKGGLVKAQGSFESLKFDPYL